MRKDFHKVVTERPRRKYIIKGQEKHNKKVYADIYDVAPGGKEGIRRPYRSNSFNFNDHVQPLRRFLEKQVGRKWDDVYSEICKAFPSGGVLQDHIRGHVFDFIAVKTFRAEDGNVYSKGFRRFGGNHIKVGAGDIYVHPETGIICRMPNNGTSRKKRREEWEAKQRETHVKLDDNNRLLKVDGIWYHVKVDRIPEDYTITKVFEVKRPYGEYEKAEGGGFYRLVKNYRKVYDVIFKVWVDKQSYNFSTERWEFYGGRDHYAVSKRALGRRELKQYGVKNDPL